MIITVGIQQTFMNMTNTCHCIYNCAELCDNFALCNCNRADTPRILHCKNCLHLKTCHDTHAEVRLDVNGTSLLSNTI